MRVGRVSCCAPCHLCSIVCAAGASGVLGFYSFVHFSVLFECEHASELGQWLSPHYYRFHIKARVVVAMYAIVGGITRASQRVDIQGGKWCVCTPTIRLHATWFMRGCLDDSMHCDKAMLACLTLVHIERNITASGMHIVSCHIYDKRTKSVNRPWIGYLN